MVDKEKIRQILDYNFELDESDITQYSCQDCSNDIFLYDSSYAGVIDCVCDNCMTEMEIKD